MARGQKSFGKSIIAVDLVGISDVGTLLTWTLVRWLRSQKLGNVGDGVGGAGLALAGRWNADVLHPFASICTLQIDWQFSGVRWLAA